MQTFDAWTTIAACLCWAATSACLPPLPGEDTDTLAPVQDADDDDSEAEGTGVTSGSGSGSPQSDSGATTEDDGSDTDSAESGGATDTEMTTAPGSTTEPETSGSDCMPEDECRMASDCPTAGAMCIECVCSGGDDPPTTSDYGTCDLCAMGETPLQILGVEGCFCSPSCDGAMSMCPDPNEGSGTAMCAVGPEMESPEYCALLCTPGVAGVCPTGATCQDTGQVDPKGNPIGVCMHPVPA
jgi:hypothetical protein